MTTLNELSRAAGRAGSLPKFFDRTVRTTFEGRPTCARSTLISLMCRSSCGASSGCCAATARSRTIGKPL